nr:hypothetical protein [Tanacetum cinerariifolium]
SADPHNKAFREEELRVLRAYKAALKDEEFFLRQKAKVEWLKVGDRNSKYFHNVVKGQSSNVIPFSDPDRLFVKKLSVSEALNLVRIISNEEIKLALFDIDGNKAPGPDEINSNVISLVPKVAAPSKLMRYYHRNRGPAKCAFKIDIEKAYDSVEWIFLSNTLKHFSFPELMVKWIMNCVTSTSFSVTSTSFIVYVNGDHMGFFKGMRGLRQGDPLSPYLFTLVMEVFNLVLRREIDRNPAFRFHWQCKELKLTHLRFADDLLLFCNGDSNYVAVLKNAISIFGGLSGLLPNFSKSMVFFGNVRDARKRLLDWKNKSLSFAGRLQLIKSVM